MLSAPRRHPVRSRGSSLSELVAVCEDDLSYARPGPLARPSDTPASSRRLGALCSSPRAAPSIAGGAPLEAAGLAVAEIDISEHEDRSSPRCDRASGKLLPNGPHHV
jgi:hypothetical protein